MKNVFLLFALIAAVFTVTNLNSANATEKPAITISLEDDGFVDVKLEDLNEQVQASINALLEEYDVQALKYNSEKKVTKVSLVKKDDQTTKVVYFDDSGKKKEKEQKETEQLERMEQELPTA